MKKFFKKAAVISLAGALSVSALSGLVGCGGGKDKVSVFIFAGADDIETNKEIVYNWGKQYKAKMIASGEWTEDSAPAIDEESGFKIATESVTANYFTTLRKQITAGNAADVFYISPKYVRAWAKQGVVLDLTDYIDFSTRNVTDVWQPAISLYGYDKEQDIVGSSLTYDSASGDFKNADGGTSGLYGLPKDYSTFGLAYNANFFLEEEPEEGAYGYTRTAYETTSAASFGDSGVITVNGKDATGVININTPTTYKPYNFYRFSSYEAAIAGGDPVAKAAESVGGYTVTIPGYPGDTFEIKAEDQDQDVAYDASVGYVTYTYAEYSAVTWAVTYYVYKNSMKENPELNGAIAHGSATVWVYGNDQYEGSLYLLPWLYGNDADYISADYTSAEAQTLEDYDGDGKVSQTGVNSDNFIEAYAAFLAYGSDWNGNSYYAGNSANQIGGWDAFNGGYLVFYGVGTWDMPSLNKADKSILDYQVMPEPVSEDFALYSKVKDANYEAKEYGALKTSYTDTEWYDSQVARQNQWAARLDSVGYGANGNLEELRGTKYEWKIAACADLVATLTIDESTQVQLTYAGSQLPNFASMCEDYLYYMEEDRQESGEFRYMITPDNAEDENGNYEANPNNPDYSWDKAYALAKRMADDNSRTAVVSDWMATNAPTYNYNTNYSATKIAAVRDLAVAMRVLNMISYDYESRNLMLRMTSGANSVRDSATYTYDSAWIDAFGTYKVNYLIAYSMQEPGGWDKVTLSTTLVEADSAVAYYTPATYCKWVVADVQELLDNSLKLEADLSA